VAPVVLAHEGCVSVTGDSDREEFFRVFHSQYGQLVRLARLLGAGEDAEDLVQTAFVNCFRRGRLLEAGTAGAYLNRTVVNLCRSRWRRRRVAANYPWLHPRETASATDVETQIVVRRALGQLPRRQREAIVLRYFADLTEADTAAAMRVSKGAVKSYTSRGLAQLGAWMKEEPQ